MESSSGEGVIATSGATCKEMELATFPPTAHAYFDRTPPTSVSAKAADEGRMPDLVVLGVELLRLVFGEMEVGVTQPSALFFGEPPLRLPNCGEPTTVERAETYQD